MFSRINVCIGLAIGITAPIGLLIFVITALSININIIHIGIAVSVALCILCTLLMLTIVPNMKLTPVSNLYSYAFIAGNIVLFLSNVFFIVTIFSHLNKLFSEILYGCSIIASVFVLDLYKRYKISGKGNSV